MQRQTIFTIRVNKEERQLISKLAQLLQRSQSDAIRYVLAQALRKLERDSARLGTAKSI
jgi:hypothetical protein